MQQCRLKNVVLSFFKYKKQLLPLFVCMALLQLRGMTRQHAALFPLSEIRLHKSAFLRAQQTDMQYMLSLDVDRLLAPFLKEAGLQPKAASYGNWENSGLDGHIGGHYLSALANMYAATGNEELLQRMQYMLRALETCQQQNKDGYVGGIPGGAAMWEEVAAGKINANSFSLNGKWVPLYNIHKLFAGLLDCWQLTGNAKAGVILLKLSNWFAGIINGLTDAQVQDMLRSEHGGLNEIFAALSMQTGNKKYLALAKRLSHLALLNPLLQHKDSLTGLHANTQIPKVIGYARIADAGGNPAWRDAADFFWQTVVHNRSVSIGGNSVREHFHSATDFSSVIDDKEGPETCNTYNMLKLSKYLFLQQTESNYMDYYERALYNHILSSQHPQGGFVYFTPMRPRHYRVYSQPQQGFWCCVGSGLENHGKYGELIYAHEQDNLFVNLFIPSVLNWKEKKLTLEQQTNFPYSNVTSIRISITKPRSFNLYVRYPSWLKEGAMEVKINGQPVVVKKNNFGYATLHRTWKNGDRVTIVLPMEVQAEGLPDSSKELSFLYGPVVLGAATDTTDLVGLRADDGRMSHIANGSLYPLAEAPMLVGSEASFARALLPVAGKPLHFTASNLIYPAKYKQLELQPFFEIHDSRYMLYWPYTDEAGYAELLTNLKAQEKEMLALDAITIDRITAGEQQPESDHGFEGEGTQTGLYKDRHWRNARGWFSYQLSNKNLFAQKIRIWYSAAEKNDGFSIYLNNRLLQKEPLTGAGGNDFVTIDYLLPPDMLQAAGSKILHLKFVAETNASTAKVFEVRLLR